jgi:AcrR family transcriptional regulator
VSPRTFLRYFATKEDVIIAWLDDEFALLVQTLVQWPVDATPVNAMVGSMRAFLASYEARRDFFLKIEKVIAASPAITDRKAAKASSVGNELRAILATRMGLDEVRDLLPGLIAGTVACACGAAIRSWLAVDGKANLVTLYDEAIDSIDFNGLDRSCHGKPQLIAS